MNVFLNEFIYLNNIMSWEQEPLWTKARLFIERAFEQQQDDEQFGLWAAFSLELLARSAVSSVSPTLLADSDQNQRNLLYALGRGAVKYQAKSIGASQVLQLCKTLFEGISEADVTAGMALVNRRNEELHSGGAAFEEYPTNQWLVGFHRICKTLCEAQSKRLEDFYGEDEAVKAVEMMSAANEETKSRVKGLIVSHKRVFDEKSADEKRDAIGMSEKQSLEAHWRGGRQVTCPACGAKASIQGENYGKESVTVTDDEVMIRQPMIPRSLRCLSCGLHLRNVGELDAAGLGGRYTSTSYDSAADYFGLRELDGPDQCETPYMDE